MNAIVQTINSAGWTFVNSALPMLIQSGVLILIVLAVDLALRRRVRAVFRYWIWLLVLLKLVLPPSLWSPVSFGTWFGETLEPPALALYESPAPQEPNPAPGWQPQAKLADGAASGPAARGFALDTVTPVVAPQREYDTARTPTRPVATTASEPAVSLNWPGLVLLAWLATATGLLLLLLQRALFVKGLVAQAEPASRRLQNALSECQRRLGLRQTIALRVSPNATSPAVCGLFRPVILIPSNLAPKLQGNDLQAVLLHELAHIKRGDLWVNLIQTLLQIVYFYNPLFWLANAAIRRVREQAVDETVLVAMGQAARDYPETLVNIARLAFKKRPALSLRLIGVVESKSALSSRIRHILGRPFPKTARLGLVGLLAVIIIAAVLLPMADATERSQPFASEGGPLDIELIAVRPNAGDEFYDPTGKKLDWNPGFLRTLPFWGRDWRVRDFILRVPDTDEPVLFAARSGMHPIGTSWHRKIGGPLPMGRHEGNQLCEWSLQVPHKAPAGKILGLIPRSKPVHHVHLTLRYFHGPPQDPACTFTGPFKVGATFTADGDDSYTVTCQPRRPFSDGLGTFEISFSANIPRDADKPIIVYTTDGRKRLPFAHRTRNTFFTWPGPLDRIAKITFGERPHERVFRNVAVRYPGDSSQAYAPYLDRMAEVLGLGEVSKEDLFSYNFRTAEEAVAVIDFIQGHYLIDQAVSTLIHARPTELSFMDETVRRKLRPVARKWAASFDLHLRIAGVQLGLFADGPEFIEQALALLQDDYRYLPDPDDIRYDLEQISFILWKRHVDRLTPQQNKILEACLRNNAFLPIHSKTDEAPTAPAVPLTERAAKVMPVAEQEARGLNHSHIGTEHILLALARQESSVSARVFSNLGIDIETLRSEVNKFVRPGPEPVTTPTLRHTWSAKRVMKHARQEAHALGHDYLGAEHILLGLTEEANSVAAQVLANLDLPPSKIRAEVLKLARVTEERVLEADSDHWQILDLRTGALLSTPKTIPASEIRRSLRELGKGDLTYSVKDGNRLLLLMRGATTEKAEEAPGAPLAHQAHRIGQALPEELIVTTAEGRPCRVTVLAADDTQCVLKYWLASRQTGNARPTPAVSAFRTNDETRGTAELPNGVTVKLIGLCKRPRVNAPWWDLKGRRIAEPHHEADTSVGTVSEECECTLLTRLTGGSDPSAVFKIPSGYVGGSSRPGPNGSVILGLSKIPPRPIGDAERIDIEVGVAQGPWIDTGIDIQNRADASPVTVPLQGNDAVVVEPLSSNEHVIGNRRATVLSALPNSTDYQFRAEFTTTDGRVLQHGNSMFTRTRGEKPQNLILVLESVWPREISRFRLFYRQFEYASFEDIPLRPDPSQPSNESSPDQVSKAQTFGPVIERQFDRDRWIDLDRNVVTRPPNWVARENTAEVMLKWFRTDGIDAVAERSPKILGLGCIDVVAVRLDEQAWTHFDERQLREALSSGDIVEATSEGDLQVVYLRGTGTLPAVYGFRTREGTIGILQNYGRNETSGGLRIRYKILQNEDKQNKPPAERVAKVMPIAEQEARNLNHSYIGTEHILLALARQKSAISARVFANLGVDIETLRREVNKLVRAGAEPVTKRTLSRTPRAERVMKYAREESRALGHDYLGTEHILLGLTEETNSIAAQVLANLNLTPQQIRAEVFKLVRAGDEIKGDTNAASAQGRRAVRKTTLPDVDQKAMMLDLASGELVDLPPKASGANVQKAILDVGKGDLIFDSRALILVRNATSAQAETRTSGPFPMCAIGQRLPEIMVVTTTEGHRYKITVLSVEKGKGCAIQYSQLASGRGAGGGAPVAPSGVVAKLPNDVTIELLAYSWLSPGDGLIWYSPNGEETKIPGVYEADVEGLGTVLAVRVEPAEAELYAQLYRGPDQERIEKTWRLPKSNIRLLSLGEERRFANLKIMTRVRMPAVVETIPLSRKDVGQLVDVNKCGLAKIVDLQILKGMVPDMMMEQYGLEMEMGVGTNRTESMEAQDVTEPPFLRFTCINAPNSYPSLTALLDTDGKTHPLELQKMRRGDGTYSGQLWPDQLAGLVVEASPVRAASVNLRNISLTPQHVTEVRVEADPKQEIEWHLSDSRLALSDLTEALKRYRKNFGERFPTSLWGLKSPFTDDAFARLTAHIAYQGEGKTPEDDPRSIIAYDKTLLPQGKGTYVLYSDNQYEFQSQQELRELGILEPARVKPAAALPEPGQTIHTALKPLGKRALSFDGVDDCLIVPASSSLTLKPPFSIEMWIKPDFSDPQVKRPHDMVLVRKGAALEGTGRRQSKGYVVFTGPSSKPTIGCQADLFIASAPGKLAQIGLSLADRLKLDRPGWSHLSLNITREDYIPAPDQPVVIGHLGIPGGSSFKGQIAEIRIWNRPLTNAETTYYGSMSLKGDEPGLVACWDFEHQSGGQIVYDISPNANHAHLGKTTNTDSADPTWVDLGANGATASGKSSQIGTDRTESVDILANLRQLALGTVLFIHEHKGDLPPTLAAIEPYLSDAELFAWTKANVTYIGKGNTKDYPKPWRVPIAYAKTATPTGGRCVAFLDGHALLVGSERFKKLSAAVTADVPKPISTAQPMSLARLLDEAQAGDVVTIPKGTYSEPIEINKPLVLRGQSRDDCILEVTANRPAILVNAANSDRVTIENMTIRWQLATDERTEYPSALVVKDSEATIRNCRFAPLGDARQSPIAVQVAGSSESTVENCRFTGFEFVICFGEGAKGVVQDCVLTDCGRQGVINYAGSTLTVQRNIITGSKYHAVRCTGGTLHVKDNLLIGNANRGIYLGNKAGRGTIINNVIAGNGTGISGFGSARYAIRNNVILDNTYAGISMRDYCRLSIHNNVLAKNQRGIILHKEGTENGNLIGTNAFWENDTNVENLEEPENAITTDPGFADPNQGDFSIPGSMQEQGPGLTDPEIIKRLWAEYEKLPKTRITQQTPKPSRPATEAKPETGTLAWRRTDRYVAPDAEGFFPDDEEGGRRLDALFAAPDKDQRSDAEIFTTVRAGFRRTTKHRTLILRWIGNRYVWNKNPQHPEAIEIMYHATPMERHYAIYFGLSVVREKTPNILRTLAEICMQGEEVGRITWGTGAQCDELVPYIKPYLTDDDPNKREIASVLIRHFAGELDFGQWKEARRIERVGAEFGDRLPRFKEILLTGESSARREVMTAILRHQLAPLLDDSFLPAMKASADDPDRKVRNEVARTTGGHWVWSAKEQHPEAIALMLKLTRDEDREVRYNAVYYGLSVVRDKTEPIVRRLVELALADQENNFYGRIVWGLKGSMRTASEVFEKTLAAELERAGTDAQRTALIRKLYKDVLDRAMPTD